MSRVGWVADGALAVYGLLTLSLATVGLYYGLVAVERVVRGRFGDERDGDRSPDGPRPDHRSADDPPDDPWYGDDPPAVTVQVPVYDERHVVGRVLRAVGRLDWPAEKLQVQVVDDSTDDTTAVVEREAGALGEEGVEVEHLRRDDRTGYKAGAVEAARRTATGEFIALFDADFVPPPDFLTETVPHFEDPRVGCVQTRWEHRNESYSWFTRAQALALDAHFSVEQWVRARVGSLMSFNATSCVWRRSTLEDVGGWSSDTVAEDLDLTATALRDGWRFVYTEGYAVPCEIPPTLSGFVRQQTRWAKGSAQNVREHLPGLLGSEDLSPWATFHSALHVLHYVFYPLLLAWLVAHVLVTAVAEVPPWVLVAGFLGTTPGPLAFLALGQVLTDRAGRLRRLLAVVPLTLLGVGIAWRMGAAVVAGAVEAGGTFERTPKFGPAGPRRSWDDRHYDRPLGWPVPEVALGLWCGAGAVLAIATGSARMAPSLLFFALAFFTVVALAVRQR